MVRTMHDLELERDALEAKCATLTTELSHARNALARMREDRGAVIEVLDRANTLADAVNEHLDATREQDTRRAARTLVAISMRRDSYVSGRQAWERS